MDLLERQQQQNQRHPWEVARAEAVLQILARSSLSQARVLDVGCGDGYVLQRLCQALEFSEAVGQDIHLSDDLIRKLNQPPIKLVQQLEELEGCRFELILLLDVLEHVADPVALLSRVWREHLAASGRLLITVPAFQALFTRHDTDLKHFRRYSRRQIVRVAQASGLTVQQSGYLFSSLLLPRCVSALRQRHLPACDVADAAVGVGNWRASPRVTRLLCRALSLDNRWCLRAQRAGIILPGLSVWIQCSPA